MLNNPSPKKQEDIVVQFSYPITDTIKLPRPERRPEINFWNVIEDRKSSINFKQLMLEDIGNILWSSCKVKDTFMQNNGFILTHRPSPSAGARHPIDILVSSQILGTSQFYYYNPFEHSLNKLKLNEANVLSFDNHLNNIMDRNKGTIIWFIAHPSRTEAKYNNSMSLVWRDAGALIYCVQIASKGYGFNSCPIGSLGEPYISHMFLDFGTVFGVGGIIIG